MTKTLFLATVALFSVTFVACAPTGDESEDPSSTDSAFSSRNRDYCKSEFAKWRLDHARLGALQEVTDEERELLVDMSWNTGTMVALTCVGLKQGKDVPDDVARHAFEQAKQRCVDDRAGIEKQIAQIQTIPEQEASQELRGQWRQAAERRLSDQAKSCDEGLKFYQKMGRR